MHRQVFYLLFGVLSTAETLDLTPSPVAVAVEHEPLTLKCTNTEPVFMMQWLRNNLTVSVINQLCNDSLIDRSLYNYSCFLQKSYTWTFLRISDGEHGTKWTCRTFGLNGTVCESLPTQIYIAVPVISVNISKPTTNPISVIENQITQFQCTTSVERPRSNIRWYFKNSSVPLQGGNTSSSDNDTLVSTVGTLTYSFNRSENGKELYCTAVNIDGRTPVVSTNFKQIVVKYAPDTGPVIMNFAHGSIYKMIELVQQTLTCYVTGGNPAPTLTWNCYSGIVTNISGTGEVRKRLSWTTSNRGTGTCTCTSSQVISGNQSVSLNVVVMYPPTTPEFSANGTTFVGTLKEIKGRSLEVNCSSSSEPSPSTYSWTKIGLGTVSNSKVIKFSSVQNSSQGTFKCIVYNNMNPTVGTSTLGSASAQFILQVLSPPSEPVFSYKSQVLSDQLLVVLGDDVNVSCTSYSNPDPATYFWNGQPSGIPQLVIINIQTSRLYTCTVSNTMIPTVGHVVYGQNQAKLNITVMRAPTVPSLLYFAETGESRTLVVTKLSVIKGSTFSIKCYGSTSTPDPDSYSWTGIVTSGNDTVTFKNIQPEDIGTSTCHVTNKMVRNVGATETGRNSKQIYIDVLYPPQISAVADINVTEYSSLNIQCKATGNPQPTTYTWTRSKDSFQQALEYLTIGSVTRADTDVYKCTVRNMMSPTVGGLSVLGESHWTISVRVLYHPNIIISQPNGTAVEGDKNVLLLCDVDGDPRSFTFTNWTQYAPDGTTIVREYPVTEISSGRVILIFPTVSYMDSGIFEIRVSNGIPDHQTNSIYARSSVQRLVRGRPVITEYERYVTAAPYGNTSLYVAFYSKDGSVPNIQWNKMQNEIRKTIKENETRVYFETSSVETRVPFYSENVPLPGFITKMFIRNIYPSDFGLYEVEINNTVGPAEQTIRLIPRGAPDPPSEFRAIPNSATQKSVIVTWISDFHGGANQTFYIEYNTSLGLWQTCAVIKGGMETHALFNATITHLSSDTLYIFRIYAQNIYGNSAYVTCEDNIKTKSYQINSEQQTDSNAGGVIGWAIAGTLGLIIIVMGALFVLYRKRRLPGCKESKNNPDTGLTNMTAKDINERSRKKESQEQNLRTASSTYENANQQEYEELQSTRNRTNEQMYDDLNPENKGANLYSTLQASSRRDNKEAVVYSNLEVSFK